MAPEGQLLRRSRKRGGAMGVGENDGEAGPGRGLRGKEQALSAGNPQGEPPSGKARTIRRMFSAVSPRYDLLNHLLSLNLDRRWRRAAVAETANGGVQRVLDLCAGTGDLGLAYLRAMDGRGLVVGADFSREMLRLGALKAARRRETRRMAFVEGDGLRLPFPAGCFDVAAVAFGLRNIADRPGAIREMARVTRPRGKVAILEFSLPAFPPLRWLYLFYFLHVLPWVGNLISGSRAYTYLRDSVMAWPEPDELTAMMAGAGLADIRWRRLTFGIACLHVGVRP